MLQPQRFLVSCSPSEVKRSSQLFPPAAGERFNLLILRPRLPHYRASPFLLPLPFLPSCRFFGFFTYTLLLSCLYPSSSLSPLLSLPSFLRISPRLLSYLRGAGDLFPISFGLGEGGG
eukprot:456633-Hanusia_phi.AAC.1